MKYSNNISTNILRDKSKEIDYVVTPNTKEIFDRIFLHNYGANKSFNLIGNYGTGKSTFLWALEKNLNKEKIFFSDYENQNKEIKDYLFIKIIGENTSFLKGLAKELKLRGKVDNARILKALEAKRKAALKKKQGLVLVVDEFGKFLEYASSNKGTDELFLLQQISEWANNDDHETYFITTLHQNFSSYGKNLSSQDKLEWEKVKGRFVDLVFNEPVEQLIYFASKKLKEFSLPNNLEEQFRGLLELVKESKLVSHNKSVNEDLSKSLFPLDWLSANILVNSLQRYGQNERSLFSFLNDDTKYSIKNINSDFYTVSNVYDYLVNTLPTEINSPDNPHRAQWLTAFRTLERAELIFEDDYKNASEVIKTIGLVNIFSKMGGRFDSKFLENYFQLSKGIDVKEIIKKLEKSGLIRFYKHSNKINFFEGTDIDLEQELITISKEINPKISLSNEILSLINFPVLLVKRYSYETGTKRFFEFRVFNGFTNISSAEGPIDGYINLIFDDIKSSEIKKQSKQYLDQIFVHYKNSQQIKKEVLTILKFNKLLEKHQADKNALKLLNEEREYHVNQLKNYAINDLFGSEKNDWIYNGKTKHILSKHALYDWLTSICYQVYNNTPIYNNELVNKHVLSPPINTARKYLFRAILEHEHELNLGFQQDKFPPQKAIYISLLEETGIHKLNPEYGYYELSKPDKSSNLFSLWETSEQFLNESLSNKRNLLEFYELLEQKPFKLKKGFIDFWIPIFLMAKKEDYALFHSNGNYIPFLKEDTLDLIHRKPQDYLIKSYDVSGLKLNLLESYKELVQIEETNNRGTQSTFLSIFGNFLRFQRGLNQYALKTSKLSNTAIKLREAILNSKDPEDALFNQFPTSLGYHSLSIKEDVEVLGSFTNQMQEAIREIRSAYDDLLDRIEKVISNSFDCTTNNFRDYKKEIIDKTNFINPATLAKKQNIFYTRVRSPLDDKSSWIKSVADVALGKPLDELLDEEESLLIKNIEELAIGLIKASEISNFNKNSNQGKLFSIRVIGAEGVPKDEMRFIKFKESDSFMETKTEVTKSLGKLSEDDRKNLLLVLLSSEMNIVE